MGSPDKQGKLWGTAVADWAELNEPNHAAYWSAMLDDMVSATGQWFPMRAAARAVA